MCPDEGIPGHSGSGFGHMFKADVAGAGTRMQEPAFAISAGLCDLMHGASVHQENTDVDGYDDAMARHRPRSTAIGS